MPSDVEADVGGIGLQCNEQALRVSPLFLAVHLRAILTREAIQSPVREEENIVRRSRRRGCHSEQADADRA